MANLADIEGGGAAAERYTEGKTKERCQGSHATAQRTSRRRLLTPNTVVIWKAATASAIRVHSHRDTFFGGLFYDAVSASREDSRITVGWIGKDLEGSDRGLIEVTPLDLLGEAEKKKNIFIITDDPVKIRTRYFPSTCLQLKRAHTHTRTVLGRNCGKLLCVGT
jgi:hypothetical protein